MIHRFRNKPRVTAVRAVALAAVGLLAFGTHAAAEDTPPVTEPAADATAAAPVVAASSAVTLPLFGAPLVVDINMDPAGNLVDVALNQPGDFTASTVKPNKVVFVNEVEGVSVKVKAKHGGERIDARAADLAGVSGPGQWSGDVFENGQATVVDFTVGAGADGAPDITAVVGHVTARVHGRRDPVRHWRRARSGVGRDPVHRLRPEPDGLGLGVGKHQGGRLALVRQAEHRALAHQGCRDPRR